MPILEIRLTRNVYFWHEQSPLCPQCNVTVSGLESYSPHSSVEVREVKLPLYGVEGQQAVLQCIYNSLQPVYSVKW